MSDPPQPMLKTRVPQAPQLIFKEKVDIQRKRGYPAHGIHMCWAWSCWKDQTVGKDRERYGDFNYPHHPQLIFGIK